MNAKKYILLSFLVLGLIIPGFAKEKDKQKKDKRGRKKPPVAAEITPGIYYLLGGVPLAMLAWKMRKNSRK